MSEPHPADTLSAPPARARRRGRLLLTLLGLPVALLVGGYLYLILSAEWELRQAIAEADRLEAPHGWRLHELEAGRAVVVEEENSAPLLMATYGLFPVGWGRQPQFLNPLRDLPPEARLNEAQVTVLRAEVQKAAAALPLARRLADLPSGRYVISWSPDYISTTVPHFGAVHNATHLLQYDAWLRVHDGDADGALTSVRAAFGAARSLGDEPYTLTGRVYCREHALQALERVLAQGNPSAEALQDMQQLLEDEERLPVLLTRLRGERAGLDQLMASLQERGVSGGFPTHRYVGPAQEPTLADRVSLYSPGGVKRQRAALLRYMTRAVEAAKLPPEQQQAALHEIAAGTVDEPFLVRALTYPVQMAAERPGHAPAQMRCAIAAVAAERYRLAQGGWPESLEALVTAGLLREVPADPYGGAPLRFVRLNDGVLIYSLGPDGRDDGVKPAPLNPMVLSTDLGFRLWDVDRRRQPPPPKPASDPPPPGPPPDAPVPEDR
jgi:hypothetical protein